MSTEDFDLDRRLESIKATAIKFVQDMDEAIIVDGGIIGISTTYFLAERGVRVVLTAISIGT